MQRYLINHLNSGEFIFLLMIFIAFIAIVIELLVQRFFPSFIKEDNIRFIGFFLGTISATYGFILGFIIVNLWKELYEVEDFIIQEAEYLSLLVYNSSAFPQAIQNELMKGIEHYIRIIIQEEWPLMRVGEVSNKTVPALSNLFHIIQSYSPETTTEITFYSQFVNNLNKVVEFRRKRFEYLDSSLVDVIRFMFVFGMIVILFLTSLIYNESLKLKTLTIVLVSSVLSFNLGLALLLDYPLSGNIAAKPTPFTKGILERFNIENPKE